MREYAMILGTNFYNPATGKLERTEYKWDGKSPYTYVSYRLADYSVWIEHEKIMMIGPYKLAVVENDIMRGEYYCRRIDTAFSWLPVFWHKINRIFEIAYRRFIVTLSIWGLAEYGHGYIPHAGQIYIVQKVKKLWKKLIS